MTAAGQDVGFGHVLVTPPVGEVLEYHQDWNPQRVIRQRQARLGAAVCIKLLSEQRSYRDKMSNGR
jgi:hypothetical protein